MNYDVVYPKVVVDTKSGEEKTYWPKVGVAFQDEDGKIRIQFDSLPIASLWDGRIFLYPKQ